MPEPKFCPLLQGHVLREHQSVEQWLCAGPWSPESLELHPLGLEDVLQCLSVVCCWDWLLNSGRDCNNRISDSFFECRCTVKGDREGSPGGTQR